MGTHTIHKSFLTPSLSAHYGQISVFFGRNFSLVSTPSVFNDLLIPYADLVSGKSTKVCGLVCEKVRAFSKISIARRSDSFSP